MRRLLVLIIAVLATMVIGTSSAMAGNGNAHFIKSLTTGTLSGANLVVNFKESGLASGATETISVTATITQNWFCVNNGGGQPSAKNKHTSTSQGSASGQFTADINGNVTGSLTITAPTTPSDGFTCPSGQNLELGSVSYTGILIDDKTSGASLTLADVSSGCLLTDVRFGKFSCTGT